LSNNRVAGITAIRDAEDSDYIAVAATVKGPRGRQGVPFLGWGPPGIGKSSLIESTLGKIGYTVVTMNAGEYEPSDFAGIPRLTDDPHFHVKIHPLLKQAWNGGEPGHALLIDDITWADVDVQRAIRRLVLAGQIGGYDLCHVPVFLTANPEDEGALYELMPPFANVVTHYEMARDNADRYEEGENLSPRVDPDQIRANYDNCHALSRALTNKFKRDYSQHRMVPVPTQYSRPNDYAFATPRTWRMATDIMAGCLAGGVSELRMIRYTVGAGAADSFARYTIASDLPSPEDVFAGRVKFELLAPDAAYTAAMAAAWAMKTSDHVRSVLAAAMKLRTEACAPDVMGPALRKIGERTTDPEDVLHGQLTDELGEEIIETKRALGVAV